MLNWFKKDKVETVTFEKVHAEFMTVDGEKHIGCEYNWCKTSGIICSTGKYIMYDVKSDGYLYDEKMLMYPIQNVISIEWIVDARKICADRIKYNDRFRIFFTNEEVAEFEELR